MVGVQDKIMSLLQTNRSKNYAQQIIASNVIGG